jgi:hypothetical protein
MKFIPILFSTEMVQAILEGRKTQTRREVNFPEVWPDLLDDLHSKLVVKDKEVFNLAGEHQYNLRDRFGKPGDVLWVRESWAHNRLGTGWPFHYIALNDTFSNPENEKWKPSIHMPKAACRIWLRVKSVRVERLQDISEKDIIAEGVRIPVSNKSTENNKVVLELGAKDKAISFLPKGKEKLSQKDYLFAFWAELWCKVNGRESWDANPWVWVVEFERLDAKPESF